MEIKELNKEQKLNILNEILGFCPKGNCFLCVTIPRIALSMCYITKTEYYSYFSTDIAKSLIPELSQFEPSHVRYSWFKTTAERVEAVRKMIKIIKEK
ncbi:MAG: hypothetical protein LBC68_11005 [Prevotellaceae bacterium]|jgi:hypothetical protein|nr:hypothetical protein [Prevotellaceae bacterium]